MVFAKTRLDNDILYITFEGDFKSYEDSCLYINTIKDLYTKEISFNCVFDVTSLSSLSYNSLLKLTDIFKKHMSIFKDMENLSKQFMRSLVVKVDGYWCQFFVNLLLKIRKPVIEHWKICSSMDECERFICQVNSK